MPIARGPMEVDIEAEPPFLEQDGLTLNHNVGARSSPAT